MTNKFIRIVKNETRLPFEEWFYIERLKEDDFFPKSCVVSYKNAEWLNFCAGDFGSRGDSYQIHVKASKHIDDETIVFYPFYFGFNDKFKDNN